MTKLENFSIHFWNDLNVDYFNFLALKMFPLKIYLKDYYKLTDQEIKEYEDYIENEVYSNTKQNCAKKAKEISTIGIELFKKKFWFEKEDIQRHWNRLEEEEIDALFKKYRAEYLELFDCFKLFKIIKNPLKQCKYKLILNRSEI
jgi:hypothetical protein